MLELLLLLLDSLVWVRDTTLLQCALLCGLLSLRHWEVILILDLQVVLSH